MGSFFFNFKTAIWVFSEKHVYSDKNKLENQTRSLNVYTSFHVLVKLTLTGKVPQCYEIRSPVCSQILMNCVQYMGPTTSHHVHEQDLRICVHLMKLVYRSYLIIKYFMIFYRPIVSQLQIDQWKYLSSLHSLRI